MSSGTLNLAQPTDNEKDCFSNLTFLHSAVHSLPYRSWETGEAMWVNNLPKVATQWNSGATRDSNPGHRARIPSALTTRPLSHTRTDSTDGIICCWLNGYEEWSCTSSLFSRDVAHYSLRRSSMCNKITVEPNRTIYFTLLQFYGSICKPCNKIQVPCKFVAPWVDSELPSAVILFFIVVLLLMRELLQ